MMAGDVSVKLIEGNLFIRGDYLANSITIGPGVTPDQIVVSGLTTGGAATSINGTPNGTTTVNGFTRDLKINMLGGDDKVVVSDITIRDNTVINTHDGVDTVTISDVIAKGNLKINLGRGADTLTMTDTSVTGTTKIVSGIGNDNLTLTSLATNKLNTKMGSGNDMLAISNVTTSKSYIDGGSGTNALMDDLSSHLYNPLIKRIT